MNYERESIWLLIGMGGAAVFLCACAVAAGTAIGMLMWGAR